MQFITPWCQEKRNYFWHCSTAIYYAKWSHFFAIKWPAGIRIESGLFQWLQTQNWVAIHSRNRHLHNLTNLFLVSSTGCPIICGSHCGPLVKGHPVYKYEMWYSHVVQQCNVYNHYFEVVKKSEQTTNYIPKNLSKSCFQTWSTFAVVSTH
jgi:hypothetical protein